MTDEKKYDDPTNRVVCVFDDYSSAVDAKAAFIQFGFEQRQVHLLDGKRDASAIDTSAKWFADTDVDLKKFAQELRSGSSIISVPVRDCDCREGVNDLLKRHGARDITHFGEWLTEVMK
jgi:hypothetical protein